MSYSIIETLVLSLEDTCSPIAEFKYEQLAYVIDVYFNGEQSRQKVKSQRMGLQIKQTSECECSKIVT